MLNLRKIRKMAYIPSGRNQENQENSSLLEDGHLDGGCAWKMSKNIFKSWDG